jgi:hypothetical protein
MLELLVLLRAELLLQYYQSLLWVKSKTTWVLLLLMLRQKLR